MATGLICTGTLRIGGTYTGPLQLNAPVHRLSQQLASWGFGYGTGTGQANRVMDEVFTAGSLSQNLVIGTGGPEVDAWDDAVLFSSIKLAAFINQSSTYGVTLTGDFVTAQLTTGTNLTLGVNGALLFYSPTGYTVELASDTISYQRTGGTNADFRVVLIGVS